MCININNPIKAFTIDKIKICLKNFNPTHQQQKFLSVQADCYGLKFNYLALCSCVLRKRQKDSPVGPSRTFFTRAPNLPALRYG